MICAPHPPLRSACLYCISFLMRFHSPLSLGRLEHWAVGGAHLRRVLPIYIPSLMGMDLPALDSQGDHIPFPALMDRKSGSSFCSREVGFCHFQGKKVGSKVSAWLKGSQHTKPTPHSNHPEIMAASRVPHSQVRTHVCSHSPE